MEFSVTSLWLLTHFGKMLASLWMVRWHRSTNTVCVCVCLHAVFMSRYGLFLGSWETFLAASRGLLHTGWLCRRLYTKSHLPRGLTTLCTLRMLFHIFTYAYLLHFDICYLISLSVGRTFLCEISQGSRDQKCKGKRYRVEKGCFKYSTLILSPPSLHLQSTTQNALLQMGCTPPSPPPHDLLVRIGLCTVLYCGVFCQQRLLCM